MLPKINKILYATGMGAGAPYVYRYALEMARQHDAKIIAVSALEALSPFARNLVEVHIPAAQQQEITSAARQEAKERLMARIGQLCAKESAGDARFDELLDEIRIEEGQPAQVVLDVAQEMDVDLIIMGSHRHTVLEDAVLGSTTHKVLHKANRPVLVVRIPEGYYEEGF